MRTIQRWRLGMPWPFAERAAAAAEASIELTMDMAVNFELEADDPRSPRLREALLRRGAKESAKDGFSFRLVRRFNQHEIDGAPYLWYKSGFANSALTARGKEGRTPDGSIVLEARWSQDPHGVYHRQRINVWNPDSDGFILRNGALRAFDPVKFGPVQMRSLFILGDDRPIANMAEVRATTELPPFAPGTVVRPETSPKEPLVRGLDGFRSPGYDDFIPAYRRSEFEAIGPFHLARTWEYRRLWDPEARRAVVSQEFRRFIDANAGPADISWVPVMLVD